MHWGNMDFFTFVYDYVFIVQLVTVSVALVVVFYPLEKSVKSFLIAFAHVCALFGVSTLLNWGLFALSKVWHFIAGINFPFSWLILIAA